MDKRITTIMHEIKETIDAANMEIYIDKESEVIVRVPKDNGLTAIRQTCMNLANKHQLELCELPDKNNRYFIISCPRNITMDV